MEIISFCECLLLRQCVFVKSSAWTSFFRPITDPAYEDINNAFERSLVFMHKVSILKGLTNL